jgi:hypothetical protein
MTQLIGRGAEQGTLTKALDSPEAELISVYGRRRVGKTFLVRQFFDRDICFELTGVHGAPLREQLRNFAGALGAALGSGIEPAPPGDWHEAFRQLVAFLEGLPRRRRKRVVFLDELPWLASRRSGFLRAFEHFWNSWAAKQPQLIVVVCGSAAAWMIERLLHARGGLHNRVTRRVRLQPFTLAETREYLSSRGIALGDYATLELYMALGGIPHYLKEVERGESAAQNIDRICLSPHGLLRDEFTNIYASLFEHAERHERVVRALARKPYGMTRGELLRAARLTSGGGTTTLLEELEESGFVLRTAQFGLQTKEACYRLSDEYSLFYLRWVERHRSSADHVWVTRRSSPGWHAWSGYAFEGICLKHVQQLKRALGIEAVETAESSWHHRPIDRNDRGAQIDMLIDRKDACINLCEMKFSDGQVVIDKRYASDLRNKRDVFRHLTGTRKTLLLTMVTTYGVRANEYRNELIARTVEIDALFAP